MFQFPGLPSLWLYIHHRILKHYLKWVPSFGNLRVNGYVLLTAAYRSLSRPSSAPSAKASALCPLLLNQLAYTSVRVGLFYCFSLLWKFYWFFLIQSTFEIVTHSFFNRKTDIFDFRCLLLLFYIWYSIQFSRCFLTLSGWWRIRGSNPWPPACKAGALPAELIPHKLIVQKSVSLERRWSSRSFSNGYLVTTSPQSSVLP